MKPSTFLGLRTTIYQVPDLARARDWYADALGIEPYFDQPFYVGFNVGGFELGLHPASGAARPGPGGGLAYWGVPDIDAAWKRLIERGAREVSPIQDVGEGIGVGSVADPFGNPIGLIENPHFPNTA